MATLIILTMLLSALAGCEHLQPQGPPKVAPPAPLPVPEPPPPAEEGSLLNPGRPFRLISDLRARDIGDIVTIKITETSRAARKAATKTSRDSSIEAGVDNLFGIAEGIGANNSSWDTSALAKGGMKNDFKGEGETSRESTMTASISTRVVKVLPNGNLLVAGSRQVKVNAEDQVIVISGVIRPEDVAPDNSVLSTNVADARIEYYGRGVLADKQRPGWLGRALDWVWPF